MARSRSSPGEEGGPLTLAEQQRLNRMLSDSTYFPPEFKQWVRDWVQTGDITLGRSQITGLPNPSAEPLLPAGVILPHGGTSFSAQFLACDGSSHSTAAPYDLLFAAIGYTWGGSGSTFYVPNLTNRVLQGTGTYSAGNYISRPLPSSGSSFLEVAIVTYVISIGKIP